MRINAGRLFTLVGSACSVLSQDDLYKGILENSFIRVMWTRVGGAIGREGGFWGLWRCF